MKLKRIEVEWYDAASRSEWVEFGELPEMAKVTTRGFLVKKTKTTITVCGSMSPPQMGDCITIPRPWIIKGHK